MPARFVSWLLWVTVGAVGCGSDPDPGADAGEDASAGGADAARLADGSTGRPRDAAVADGPADGAYARAACDDLLDRAVDEVLEISTCDSVDQCAADTVRCGCYAPALGHRDGEDPSRLRRILDELDHRCELVGCSSFPACRDYACKAVDGQLVPPGTKVCVLE